MLLIWNIHEDSVCKDDVIVRLQIRAEVVSDGVDIGLELELLVSVNEALLIIEYEVAYLVNLVDILVIVLIIIIFKDFLTI
jgi:hypothetical protein